MSIKNGGEVQLDKKILGNESIGKYDATWERNESS
jgi:hypothetical protein